MSAITRIATAAIFFIYGILSRDKYYIFPISIIKWDVESMSEDILKSREKLSRVSMGIDKMTARELLRRLELQDRELKNLRDSIERLRPPVVDDSAAKFRGIETRILGLESSLKNMMSDAETAKQRTEKFGTEINTKLNSQDVALQGLRHAVEEKLSKFMSYFDDLKKVHDGTQEFKKFLESKLGEQDALYKNLTEISGIFDEETTKSVRRMPEVEGRFAELGAELKETTDTVQAIIREADELKKFNRTASERLDQVPQIEGKIAEIYASVAILSEVEEKLLRDVDEIKSGAAVLKNVLERADKIPKLDERLGSTEVSVQRLNEMGERLLGEIDTLKKESDELHPLPETLKKLPDIEKKTEENRLLIDGLTKIGDELLKDMDSMKKEKEELQRSIDELRKMGDVEKRFAGIEVEVNRMSEIGENLMGEVGKFKEYSEHLEDLKKIPDMEKKVGMLDVAGERLAGVCDDLLNESSRMKESIGKVNPENIQKIPEFEKRLREYEILTRSMSNLNDVLLSDIDAVRKETDDLKGAVERLRRAALWKKAEGITNDSNTDTL
jgi:chromosome segregation ATPase